MPSFEVVAAGPIVRQVGPDSATVWIALRKAEPSVTLVVYEGEREVARGTAGTIPALDEEQGDVITADADVHVVALTARPPADAQLRWGTRYGYTIIVGDQPIDLERLRLSDFPRPSFRLFAAERSGVRFAHGSCRKPHGGTVDGLELVESLLYGPDAPQGLFLTGDQIYADDVSDETFARVAPKSGGSRAERARLDGLTSTEAEHHLYHFEEFVRMYLWVWTSSSRVRIALANVATWMIFDDHDVTDDWNLDRAWQEGLTRAGRRVVHHALRAYALFQDWGNTPANAPRPVVNGAHWGWSFESNAFRCIALDTRTQRVGSPPALIDVEKIAGYFPAQPKEERFTLVISAAPVFGSRLMEAGQTVFKPFMTGKKYGVDEEAWSKNGKAWDALVLQLALQRHALVLSGDIHIAFMARRAGETDDHEPYEIVNVTSSALRNEDDKTHAVGWLGSLFWGTHLERREAPTQAPQGLRSLEPEELVTLTERDAVTGARLESAFTATAVVAKNHVAHVSFSPGIVRQRYHTGAGSAFAEHTARFMAGVRYEALALPPATPAARVAETVASGRPVGGAAVEALLLGLRARNLFDEMLEVGAQLPSIGRAPAVEILLAQARIDTGDLDGAIGGLQGLPASAERDGLLGRAYKQRWIAGRDRSDLERALAAYHEANRPWHAVNVMALLWASGDRVRAATIARRIIEAPAGEDDPWDAANRAEACLVLGNPAAALRQLKTYAEDVRVTAFHVRGTLRQLRELHGLTDPDDAGASLALLLETAMLQKGGLGVVLRAAPAIARGLPDGPYVPIRFYREALERARSVARIEVGGSGVGTGVLVDLSAVRPQWKRVLLTNTHVALAGPGLSARFFSPGGQEVTTRLAEPLWTSPVQRADAAIFALERSASRVPALAPELPFPGVDAIRVANLIGHPHGADGQLSTQDNTVVGTDERRLWYRAGSAPGSSGSPVFDEAWRFVGLHHAHNEGIRLDYVLDELTGADAIRAPAPTKSRRSQPVRTPAPVEALEIAAPDRGIALQLKSVRVLDTRARPWEPDRADVYPLFLVVATPGPRPVPGTFPSVFRGVKSRSRLPLAEESPPTIFRAARRPRSVDVHLMLMRSAAGSRELGAALEAQLAAPATRSLLDSLAGLIANGEPSASAVLALSRQALQLVAEGLSRARDRPLFYTVASFEGDLGVGRRHVYADDVAEVELGVVALGEDVSEPGRR